MGENINSEVEALSPKTRTYLPAAPIAGRIVRLTVVLDARNTPARLAQLALISDHAGIDAIWVSNRLAQSESQEVVEAGAALALAGQATKFAFVGGDFDLSAGDEDALLSVTTRLASGLGRRFELGLRPAAERSSRFIRACERALAGLAPLGTTARMLPPLSIEVQTREDVPLAARWADNAVLFTSAADLTDFLSLKDQLHRECKAVGRDPASLGLAVEVPVSIGRTEAEAMARADLEPVFKEVGSPRQVGVFGTLEQCQDRVIRLAHAGVSELRCRLPNTPDAHDVIAQVTGMVVGRLDMLSPDAARSKAPDPPPWAGGPARS